MDKKNTSIETTDLYRRSSSVADEVWLATNRWPTFARDTVGIQLAKSVDSIAANLVEGDGRNYGPDAIRFFVYARASAREARHWIRRATVRSIVSPESGEGWIAELTEIVRMVHALIRYRSEKRSVAKERRSEYNEDLFTSHIELPNESITLDKSLVPRSLSLKP